MGRPVIVRFPGLIVLVFLACEVPNPAYQSAWERDGAIVDATPGNSDVATEPNREAAIEEPVVDANLVDANREDANVGDASVDNPVDAELAQDGDWVPHDANEAAPDAQAPEDEDASALPVLVLPPELRLGLISYWSLDETTGSIAHDPISGNDGKVESPAPEDFWQPGYRNGGATFDRNNPWAIEVPASPTLNRITNQLTVAAWVRVKSHSEVLSVISRQQGDIWHDQYDLAVVNQRAVFHMFDARFNLALVASSGEVIPASVWLHLTGTYDGTTLRVYINGNLMGQMNGTATLFPDTKPLFIGDNINMGTYGRRETWNGDLDEVMLYERALSGNEIRTLMMLQQPRR